MTTSGKVLQALCALVAAFTGFWVGRAWRQRQKASAGQGPAEDDDTLMRHDANHHSADWKQMQLLAARRLVELSTLQEIDQRLNSTLELDDVLEVALDAVIKATGADSGFISLLEGKAGQRIMRVTGGYSVDLVGRLFPVNVGVVGRAVRSRQAFYVDNVLADHDYYPDLPGTKAQMVIPLMTHEKLIGIINLESNTAKIWSHKEFEFVETLAQRIAMATENAHLYSTTQKQLQELQTLYEQVSALEQEKTNMIRLASHDLRDPIGVIIGYLDLLQSDRQQLSEEHQLYMNMMQHLATKSYRIVKDILSLERVQQGGELKLFDMCGLVQEVAGEYRQQITDKELHFTLEVPNGEALHIMGDRSQIKEAIANLISNAIKYTPPGGRVTASLEQQGKAISFRVSDNGYGIPEDLQGQLFQPFYRAVINETQEIEGTGLGLHLVKHIIERHNGALYYQSTYGEGSSFGFHLPLPANAAQLTQP